MAGGIRQAVGRKCPSRTELARVGGDVQLTRWRVSGRRAPSGRKWKGSQSRQGATELGFPGPALGKMQSEAARRAGEPSGEGEEASSQGFGGYQLLTQTDARRPASEVMRHHLHRQPGSVGGEAARGEMVQPHAVQRPLPGHRRRFHPPDDLRRQAHSGRGCRWSRPPRRCRPSSREWSGARARSPEVARWRVRIAFGQSG